MAFMAHNWVELSVLPVTVEYDTENDNLVVLASPEAEEISSEDTHTLCWDCKMTLSHEAFEAACPKAPTPEQLSNAG